MQINCRIEKYKIVSFVHYVELIYEKACREKLYSNLKCIKRADQLNIVMLLFK